MEFVDAHLHVSDSVDSLLAELGDNMGILLPVYPNTTSEKVAKLAEKYDNLIAFASLNPLERRSRKRLRELITEYDLKGLKLHPLVQGFTPSDPKIFPLMEEAESLEIPVVFHTGPTWSKGGLITDSYPHHIDVLASSFPELTIIMAHMGGVRNDEAVMIAMRHERVYLDISMTLFYLNEVLPDVAEWILSSCPEKLIFGSDYPYYSIKKAYGEFNKIAGNAGLSQREREMVLKSNILNLVKI